MTDDPNRISREQVRREMALTLTVVVVIVVLVFGADLASGVLERLDPLTGGLLAAAAVLVLIGLRRRHGAGWTIARGLLVAVAIATAILVALGAVCVAAGCVR
jgi:hypothetical protein